MPADGRKLVNVRLAPKAAAAQSREALRSITGGVGHNLPQEAPQAFAQAVVDVAKG
jgi:pimeloyl-ACP methyl ester carboxylesterase